jgi:hypothetical protein
MDIHIVLETVWMLARKKPFNDFIKILEKENDKVIPLFS